MFTVLVQVDKVCMGDGGVKQSSSVHKKCSKSCELVRIIGFKELGCSDEN